MQRHVFLIPGFFRFANLGDFTYWGHVARKLSELLEEAGLPAEIHSVKSLPTASLRTRTRSLLETIDQAQHALYRSLARLASGEGLEALSSEHEQALREGFGGLPDLSANDGIVPTLSQPWGRCIALAQADHLDIIGHFRDEDDPQHPYDWLRTHSNFRASEFHDVWRKVVEFLAEAE